MSLTACEEYKPLGAYLCQQYPKLVRETVATEKQRPASQLPIITARHLLTPDPAIRVLVVIIAYMRNFQSMASTGNKFVS